MGTPGIFAALAVGKNWYDFANDVHQDDEHNPRDSDGRASIH
jgi:hypothetical protein